MMRIGVTDRFRCARRRVHGPTLLSWRLLTVIVWAVNSVPVRAAEHPLLNGQPPSSSTPQTADRRQELIDDNTGLRGALKDDGIDFDVEYLNYYQGIVSGDQSHSHDDDWGRIRFTVDVDFAKLARLDGLSFHFSAVNQSGGNIGRTLGSYSNPDNLASFQTTRVDTYWLQQKLFHGVLVVRAGQLAQQDDYGVQEYASSFVMEPLGYAFGNLFDNVTATADPGSKPGFELQLHPYGGFYLKSMIQAGDPDPYGNHDRHGLNFSLDGHGVLATEIGYRREEPSSAGPPAPADDQRDKSGPSAPAGIRTLLEGGLPAVYKVGVYNSFRDYTDARHGDTVHGNYLVYGMINQAIFREAHAGSGLARGLDGFASVDYSPDNVSLAFLQATGGLRYTGPIPTRNTDTLSFGVVHTEFSRRFNTPASLLANGRYRSETALELNYEWRLTPWLSVQPVGQYYFDPGGTGRRPGAFLLGFGSKVVF